MPIPFPHSPGELAEAVASARSWRGVLRELGRPEASAGSYRSIRRQIDALGIDYSHFTGQRRWSDRQLAHAVAEARTWTDVMDALGLLNHGGNLATLRSHSLRLALDVDHLAARRDAPVHDIPFGGAHAQEHLRAAGASLAAAWFQLRGYEVMVPQEGCRYDLLARSDFGFARIQVKTTTYRAGSSRLAMISRGHRNRHTCYDVDDFDYFFVIDADLDAYLIPFAVVAGLKTISLSSYAAYRVAQGGQWLQAPVSADASP